MSFRFCISWDRVAMVAALLIGWDTAVAQRHDNHSGRVLDSMNKMRTMMESASSSKSTSCTNYRPNPYSVANPNEAWGDKHTYHAQVWYLDLADIYDLWQSDYFDYVLDVRGIDDVDMNGTLLPGWQTEHIPGSFPTNNACLTGDCDALTLYDFLASDACLDAKIFVHCWVGVAANQAVEKLVQMGFTHLYAAGPQGSAGYFAWKGAGYPVVYDDVYHPGSLVPDCAAAC